MLYPLSYEGLPCVFAQHAVLVLFRRVGLAASLPTVCAAPVPRVVKQGLNYCSDTRCRLYGGSCPAKAGGRGSTR
jgi:hypothetical protein